MAADRIEKLATEFEKDVRDAFLKVYGPPPRPEDLDSVLTSYSERAIKMKWAQPDPGIVLVFTEYAWIRDPWGGDEDDMPLWDAAMEFLRKRGWKRAWHESINAAVHEVFWDSAPLVIK